MTIALRAGIELIAVGGSLKTKYRFQVYVPRRQVFAL